MTGLANPISLAAGVLPEFSPVITATAAIKAGWDATGVWVDLETWTPAVTRELKSVLSGSGIGALDVEVIWFQPGPPSDDHRRVIDIGRELGAPNALVVSSDPDPQSTADKLAILCEHGGGDIRVCLEFAMFTEVRSIAAASDIVRRARHPAAGILIDPLHLSRTGGTPADVAALDPAWLPYAQFCDVGPLTFETSDIPSIIREAVDERLNPGDGLLPLPALIDIFAPGLPLSIELRSKPLRDGFPDPVERAAALAKATRAWLADVPREKAVAHG